MRPIAKPEANMQITIRLSAALAQVTGQARLNLSLSEGATVNDALALLIELHPGLATKLDIALPFSAGSQVSKSAKLQGTQELALLLPAAGGCK